MATVLNEGLEETAKIIGGISGSAPWNVLAIGSDSTAEGATQTGCVTEYTLYGLARQSCTPTYEADYKTVLDCTWTNSDTSTHEVNEVAIHNNTTVGQGKALMRHKFAAAQNVLASGSIEITCKIVVGRTST